MIITNFKVIDVITRAQRIMRNDAVIVLPPVKLVSLYVGT